MCPTPPSRLLLQPFDLDDERAVSHERIKRQKLKEKQATIALTQLTPQQTQTQTQTQTQKTEWNTHIITDTDTTYQAQNIGNHESPTSQSSLESCSSPSSPTPSPSSASSSTPIPIPTTSTSAAPISIPQPVNSIPSQTIAIASRKRPLPLSASHVASIRSSGSSVTSSPTPSISSQDSICSSPRRHTPLTLPPLARRSRSSRLTSTEMRRRRHRYKDGIRYHSLKAQLDNLREVTLEFQTCVAREWETRTEEWSEDKKNNKKVLDRIREQRPDCGRAVLLHSASAMIRHLNNEVTVLRAKIAELQGDMTAQPQEPSGADLTACMDAMIRLAHDQHMLQMGGCMITRYTMDGVIMDTNDISCQYGYTQQAVIGTVCTSTPHLEEAIPLPPTVDIATTTAKQLMTAFLPTSNPVTPWWQHMTLVPVGMVVPFISRRRTPQGQYEINIYWRQVEQSLDGIRSIYSVGWDAKVEFMPIPSALQTTITTTATTLNGMIPTTPTTNGATPYNTVTPSTNGTTPYNSLVTPSYDMTTTNMNGMITSTPNGHITTSVPGLMTASSNAGIS